MQFAPPLICARLVRRYKRFLADIVFADGSELTVHCPNTGSMRGCAEPGSRVWVSDSGNPKRKYRYSWELVETATGALACVNTARPNQLVGEALQSGLIESLRPYTEWRAEVRYGEENSRIDWLLTRSEPAQKCFVEVKNVTLCEQGVGLFPDAVSSRGQKHLRELMEMVRHGHRAVIFFCANHTGIQHVSPADDIDPKYGALLREAVDTGVEALAYRSDISPDGILLQTALPIVL